MLRPSTTHRREPQRPPSGPRGPRIWILLLPVRMNRQRVLRCAHPWMRGPPDRPLHVRPGMGRTRSALAGVPSTRRWRREYRLGALRESGTSRNVLPHAGRTAMATPSRAQDQSDADASPPKQAQQSKRAAITKAGAVTKAGAAIKAGVASCRQQGTANTYRRRRHCSKCLGPPCARQPRGARSANLLPL